MSEPLQTYSWKDPRSNPNDRALACHFVEDREVNEAATAETGVQTYDNVLTIHVYPLGQPKSDVAHEIERTLPDGTVKVSQYHANKYGGPLALYKAGRTAESTGTPLRDLPGMTAGTEANMKARGIHTVEMLSEMSDSTSQDIMGFWALREKAKTFMAAKKENAPAVQMAAMQDDYEKKLAAMQRQIDALQALIPTPEPEAKKPAKLKAA